MKKTRDTFYTTAQGRLPSDLTRKQRQALGAYSDQFSRAERHYLAAVTRDEVINKPAFLAKFSITSRQFNAVKRSAQGKIDSQLSNLDNRLNELAIKIKRLEKARKKLTAHIDAWKKKSDAANQQQKLDYFYHRLSRVDRGLQISKSKQAAFSQQREAKRPSICLGSRRLFKAQYHLEENGYANHREWRDDWETARRSQFFVLGSKDETMGCQGCVMTRQEDGRLTLRIRMPSGLEKVHGKHLVIENVELGYQAALVDEVIERNLARQAKAKRLNQINYAARKAHKEKKAEGKPEQINLNEVLAEEGLAVNFRFVRDDKGWRVLISFEQLAMPDANTDMSKGVIGIDLNADHLAVAEIDKQGNLVKSWSIPLPSDLDASSRANRTAIEMACQEVVTFAEIAGKPIIIEDLDFTFKKANLQKGKNTRYNKMLSALSYRAFEQAIRRQATKRGVYVKSVNPAYTSFIGQVKYLNQTRGSVHEAAAMVIARRGKGHRDRLPKESRQTFRSQSRTFLLPVDRRKDLYAVYRKAKEAFDKWMAAQISELRQNHQDDLERRCQSRTVSELESELDALTAA